MTWTYWYFLELWDSCLIQNYCWQPDVEYFFNFEYRKPLHWLCVGARIQFKLMTTTWKAINDQAPRYIQQLLHRKPKQNHNLRSNSKILLQEPISQNKNKSEDRAFSFVAPKLWNDLPDYVRNAITSESFKKNLKTHLFQKFYKSK